MDRDTVIARYRHLHAILQDHNHEVISCVSRPVILDMARRLGMLLESSIIADSDDVLALLYDLAIHASRPGRSRPIDRYRKSARATPGSDQALVLDAMAGARFAIWRVECRHGIAGVEVRDVMRGENLWLMDLGVEASAPDGITLAGHLFHPGPFWMTTGMMIPVDGEIVGEAFDELPPARHVEPGALIDDPRFATLVCRAALERGAMEQVSFV